MLCDPGTVNSYYCLCSIDILTWSPFAYFLYCSYVYILIVHVLQTQCSLAKKGQWGVYFTLGSKRGGGGSTWQASILGTAKQGT